MNNYASLCDDFGVSTYVHGKLEMPTGRETVLHFFEAVQKAFPKMTEFEKRADNEYMLEEDREAGSYRWASLDTRHRGGALRVFAVQRPMSRRLWA